MNETTLPLDFAPLFPPGLPPLEAKWNGFAKYNFIGGHNDADPLPLDGLIKALNDVPHARHLRRCQRAARL
jgi:2-aminoadipate transaminase